MHSLDNRTTAAVSISIDTTASGQIGQQCLVLLDECPFLPSRQVHLMKQETPFQSAFYSNKRLYIRLFGGQLMQLVSANYLKSLL